MKLMLPMFSILVFGFSASAANSLRGQRMNCVFSESLGFGDVHTIFRFLSDSDNEVLVQSSVVLDGLKTYQVDGNLLKVTGNDERDEATYDISNPNRIVRKFKFCVTPGEGGGDSKPVCEKVQELCTLAP